MRCSLCASFDADDSSVRTLTDPQDLRTLGFLLGSEASEATKDGVSCCPDCFAKVRLVSGISEKVANKRENPERRGTRGDEEVTDDEDEDCDIEEMNRLSAVFAEMEDEDEVDEDDQNDPGKGLGTPLPLMLFAITVAGLRILRVSSSLAVYQVAEGGVRKSRCWRKN